MKNENIVCLREIVTYNEETDTKMSDEMKEDSIADKGFSIGDVFMVFEFVDYDLSGLLSSPGFVLSEQQVRRLAYILTCLYVVTVCIGVYVTGEIIYEAASIWREFFART